MTSKVTAVRESAAGGDLGDLDDNFISIHGRQEDGKIVPIVTELQYVLRFLILGQRELSYVPERSGELKAKDETKVREDIEELIETGKGTKVVKLIKDISSNYRNISQDPVVYCLALCARSDDVTTKKEAYMILNDICRIPTHLFQFIEYYTILTQERRRGTDEQDVEKKEKIRRDRLKKKEDAISEKNKKRQEAKKLKMKKVNPHAAYGWGRQFKAAITKWFLSLEPEYLAYLLTKYRRRCGWSVKTVIRLAHIKAPDRPPNNSPTDKQKAVGLILRYFRSNLKNATQEYPVENLEDDNIIKKTYEMLKNYDELRKNSTTVDTVQTKVREDLEKERSDARQDHTITVEHLSTKVLAHASRNVGLWRNLIPCMPGDALIRHTGFLTSIGVWVKQNGESEEVITKTVDGFQTRLLEFIRSPTAPGDPRGYTTKRPLHPFKIIIAARQYVEKKGARKGPHWEPNPSVTKALHEAFEQSLRVDHNNQGISSKICMAIDVSGSMETSSINGKPYSIQCQAAARALAFTLARMRSNVHLLAFNKEGCVAIETGNSFVEFVEKMRTLSLNYSESSDCTEPLKWAQKQEMKDIDAFIVLTVKKIGGEQNDVDKGEQNDVVKGERNDVVKGERNDVVKDERNDVVKDERNDVVKGERNDVVKDERSEALNNYKDFSGKLNSKFIVCTMNATISSGDTSDPHVFDICGCDTNLPLLIQEYLQK